MQTSLLWRLWWSLAESPFGGTLESEVRRSELCWRVWQESDFNRHESAFTFNALDKKSYKLCTSNAICKNGDAIICITVQSKHVHSRQFLRIILRYLDKHTRFHAQIIFARDIHKVSILQTRSFKSATHREWHHGYILSRILAQIYSICLLFTSQRASLPCRK